MPTEWYPESTYSVVAVTLRAASESRYAAAAPTSSASIGRWSGERSSTIASIVGKPAIERAASVRTGPADTAFTRMFFWPRSQARYLTDESSVAFATPITL